LNLTGVRLTDLKLSSFRPNTIRSFMERRITMASTPIIRYYDHLRLVYEVQARIRELRRNAQPEGSENQPQNDRPQPAAPGESKQSAPRKDGGSRVDPPQQSGTPALNDFSDYLETSLSLNQQPFTPAADASCLATAHYGGSFPRLQESGAEDPGSAFARLERSTVWTV
jgi:hypothetical protein